MPKPHRGACLCGAVQFEADPPSLWCAHCHCSLCRQSHGAGFVTWVGYPKDRFRLDDPDGRLSWYRTSPEAERGFCSRCGSSLLFRSERWPGEMHVVRANLDGDIDREPQAHVFWASHVEWAVADDDLPRIETTSID